MYIFLVYPCQTFGHGATHALKRDGLTNAPNGGFHKDQLSGPHYSKISRSLLTY